MRGASRIHTASFFLYDLERILLDVRDLHDEGCCRCSGAAKARRRLACPNDPIGRRYGWGSCEDLSGSARKGVLSTSEDR